MHRSVEENLKSLTKMVEVNSYIDPALYEKHDVRRGLRNPNGSGVLVGITRIAEVHGYDVINGTKIAVPGELIYRGIELNDLVAGFQADERTGFEETAFLLMFGELPTTQQLDDFNQLLEVQRELPEYFVQDVLFRNPTPNIMNMMQRAILALYAYDSDPDDLNLSNAVAESISLIAKMPLIMAYSYQTKRHYLDNQSLVIHKPLNGLSTAENILRMIHRSGQYTKEEAELLDLCMVVHADHGGGNNSAFATHVVSSTGTDTYSAIAAAFGSLKGPKHGGANEMVTRMVNDIQTNVPEWWDKGKLKDYMNRIMNKEAFDRKGLIYGMGHAVYTISDPRAIVLKNKAFELASTMGYERQFELLFNIEDIAIELYKDRKGPDANIAANVDLYSGLVYEMLGIDSALFTPIFAVSRTAGWCAHRLEQIRDEKIMRPAYVTIPALNRYIPLDERTEKQY